MVKKHPHLHFTSNIVFTPSLPPIFYHGGRGRATKKAAGELVAKVAEMAVLFHCSTDYLLGIDMGRTGT